MDPSGASRGASAALHLQPVVLLDVVLKAVQRETGKSADVRVEVPADLFVTAESESLVRRCRTCGATHCATRDRPGPSARKGGARTRACS